MPAPSLLIAATMFLALVTTSATAQEIRKPGKKTLLRHGFLATGYGELSADNGTIDGEQMSALSMRFGWQLLRFDHAGLLIGYGKTGFYDAVSGFDDQPGHFKYNHQGPLAELIISPETPLSASLSWQQSRGNLFRDDNESSDGLQSISKRELTIREARLNLLWNFHRNFQLVLGLGQKDTEMKLFERRDNNNGTPPADLYWARVDEPDSNRSEKEKVWTIGLRAYTL